MRRKWFTPLLSLILITLALTLGVASVSHLARTATTSSQASPVSGLYFDHVVIIIMEDHGVQDICAQNPPPCSTSGPAPYMAGLANSYTITSQYLGVSHFSEADYLALLGGATFGCGNTGCPPVSNQNLVDRFEAAGVAWKGYMEDQNVASGCDTTYHEPYTPEHNPFVGFTDILNNPARCANVVLANPASCKVTDCTLVNDLNSASAPNFMWLTPNNCDNMHGFTGICPVSVPMGDSYLSGLVPNILNSVTFKTQRSALFVVFDEGNGYCPLNGSSEDCVYASWMGPEAKTNFWTSNLYNHYSWTRTIETDWNLPSLTSNDANATPMSEFFAIPLSASFTYNPSNPLTQQQVTFSASATGGHAPCSYSWSFGDGSTGSGASATHSYSLAGTYTVVLTEKDSSSPRQVATSQQSITVSNPTPSLAASFTYSPSSPQTGQQVSFTGSASGGTTPYTYSWSFGDGSTGSGSSVTHIYTSAGSYMVSLTIKDSSSPQQSTTSQQTVSVTSPPPALTSSFSYSPSAPQSGQQVTFSASASGGTTPYSFSWNFGDGSTGSGSTVTHTYTLAGSFTVTLQVTDSGSPQQTSTTQQTITVANSPLPLTASFTYSPSSPQTGQQVSFTASATGGTAPYTYQWSFGDGSTGTGSSVTHTYSSAGSYTVTLTTQDSGSPQQTTTSQQTVAVTNPPPPSLSASFTFSPSNPDAGQSVTFTGSASGGASPYSFSWDFGDGGSASGASTSHTYQSGGTYTITLTVTDSVGQVAKASQTISVNNALSASFTYSPSGPLPLVAVTFTASVSGGNPSYTCSWDFGDGTILSGLSAVHSFLLAGSYTVTLTVTDSNGQSVTTSQTITVLTNLA